MPVRLLGIFAHAVDGILLCGGTLAGYAHAGVDVMAAYAGEEDRETALTAARAIGLRHLVFLGGTRGQLDRLSNGWLKEAVIDVGRAFDPQVVVAIGRSGQDADHIALADAVAQAFVEPGAENAGWPRPSRCYAALLPARQLRLLERVTPAAAALTCVLAAGRQVDATGITTIREVGRQRDAKAAALRIMAGEAAAPLAHAPEFGQEFFARMRPSPWVSGVLEGGLLPGFDEPRRSGVDIAHAS